MHKKISILIILVLTLTIGLCFCSCDKQTGERYDLVSIHFSNVTLEMYEYNYILFDFHKNTYFIEIKTKVLNLTASQKGTFSISNQNVKFTNDDIPTKNFLTFKEENALFSQDKELFAIYGSNSTYGEYRFVYQKK